MMPLLESCTGLTKSFGSRLLFENLALGISEGERLGLIGRNGAGKSTLLRILAGQIEPDGGSVSMRRNTRTGYVPQDIEFPAGKTVRQIVTEAIAGERIDDLERASRINQTIGRAGFPDSSLRTEALSGGWKRRLAIARELVRQPDLLFLDEPTNHLDFEGIAWLEKLLANSTFASVVVSHDRYFLDNVVNDMAEIDRAWPDGIFRVEGSYSHFLEKKEEFLLSQANRQEALANRVRYEVEWLRRGAKARTRKSQARIDDAGRLMRELSDLESRAPKGVTAIDFTATDRRTKRLISVGTTSPRNSAAAHSSATSRSRSRPARAWDCSASTAPARPHCCGSSPARSRPIREPSNAPPPSAWSTSTRPASSSTRPRRCARDSARTATT